MRREIHWRDRLFITIIAMTAAVLIARPMIVRGTELPVLHKAKKHHELVPDSRSRTITITPRIEARHPAADPVDRPAGIP